MVTNTPVHIQPAVRQSAAVQAGASHIGPGALTDRVRFFSCFVRFEFVRSEDASICTGIQSGYLLSPIRPVVEDETRRESRDEEGLWHS